MIKKYNTFNEDLIPDVNPTGRKFVPSGWVNVKVDNELPIRIGRYVKALDKLVATRSRADLYEKIRTLGDIENIIENSDVSIQTKIAIITLLQYVREIKTQFNAPSGGFLLESFLAALIHGQLEETGFGIADLISTDKSLVYDIGVSELRYQIKFYKPGSTIKVNMWRETEDEICDYYVIALKDADGDVTVNILDGKNENDPSYIGKFATKLQGTNEFLRTDNKGTYLVVNTNKLKLHEFAVTLEISDVDMLIEQIGENVKKTIEDIYEAISNLHYDVDSVITGVDKFHRVVKIDAAHKKTEEDIEELQSKLKEFTRQYKDTIYSPSIGIFGGTRSDT